MPTANVRVPTRLDELTGRWVAGALASKGLEGVDDVEVLQVIHGTATKVRLGLKVSGDAAGRIPASIWAKGGFEKHSKAHEEVYAGEVRFYNTLASTLPDIVPACLYAATDPPTGASILLLDDLLPKGVRFIELTETLSPEAMKNGLSMIATYQARHWMSAELHKDKFLREGGAYVTSDVLRWKFSQENLDRLTKLPRFEVLSPKLRDMDRMREAFYAIQKRWSDGPYTLNHGDAHFGQAFQYPDGRFGLLDWQCVKLSNWAQDVAYFMISGLSVQDRRAHQDELLSHYLAELARHGVTAPAFDEARETFRLHAVHGFGWVLCPPELQPEENCIAMSERFAAAMSDYGTIDRLLDQPVPIDA